MLRKAFNIRPGEGVPTLLLLSYSLCIGILVAFFFSFANATFLTAYDAAMLPWAYIATGVVGYMATSVLHRLGKRLRFSVLLTGNLLFLLVLLAGFRLGFLATDHPVLSFLIFIWIDPVLTLVDLGFWGLAGRLFDLQQSKRLFGLISSGEVASEIVGFLLVPLLLPYLTDTSDLLVLAALGLAGCSGVLWIILRRFRDRLQDPPAEEAEPGQDLAATPRGLRALLGSRYILLLSASTVALMFAVYFVDFEFLSVTSERFPNEVALAGFLGVFWGITEAVELGFKALLSSRLITQFGLFFGLVALPGAILLCMLVAVGSGTFAGSGFSVFFVVIGLAKLVSFVLQRSLYEPSFRVLFQPLPATRRFAVQAGVEGVVKQAALGLAGVGLLAITLSPALGLLSVVQILLFLVLGWVAILMLTYREYRSKLVEALSRERPREAPERSRSTTIQEDLTREGRISGDPKASRELQSLALKLLLEADLPLAMEVLEGLLHSKDPAARMEAVNRLEGQYSLAHRREIEELSSRDPDPRVRKVAERALARLDALAREDGEERIRRRAGSPDAQERLAVAALLADGGAHLEPGRREILPELFWDPDPAVRRRVLAAADRSRRPDLWPWLIEELSDGEVARSAVAGLCGLGEEVLLLLDNHFRRLDGQPEVQSRILDVYARVGRPAVPFLFNKIRYPSRRLALRALHVLNALEYRAGPEEVALVKQTLEATVDRLAWTCAAVVDMGDTEAVAPVTEALRQNLGEDVETLLLLLGLIADRQGIAVLQENLAAASEAARPYVLEIADLVVPPDAKGAVLPVLEQLPPDETLDRLSRLYPHRRKGLWPRLREILCVGSAQIDLWTRACAVEAMVRLPDATSCDELVANLFHPDPVIREVVARALRQLDPEGLAQHLERMPYAEGRALRHLLRPDPDGHTPLLDFDKVVLLRRSPLFVGVPTVALVRLAREASEKRFEPESVLFRQAEPGRTLFLLVSGRVEVEVDGRRAHRPRVGEILGSTALSGGWTRTATLRAESPVQVLELHRRAVIRLLCDHPRVIVSLARRLIRDRKTFSAFGSGFSGEFIVPEWMQYETGERP